MKTFFIFCTLILCKAIGVYGQAGQDAARWKCAFAGDCGVQKRVSVTGSGVYLVSLKERGTANIFVHPFVLVKRQLDERFYIVKATGVWIQQHQEELDYISPANNNWKLSPALLSDSAIRLSRQKNIFHITVADSAAFNLLLQRHASEIKIEKNFPLVKTFRVICDYTFITTHLLDAENILYVQHGERKPKVETPVADFNNAVNLVNLVHAEYPGITGAGLNVSVKEEKMDSTDLDLAGRYTPTTISSNTVSQHATTMATIIAGAGNSFYTGKGAAPAAQINSADFKVLMPDNAAYAQYNISVQNHSYGVGIENFYGSDAAAYDAVMIARPSLMQVFSSGNSGNENSQDGIYKNIPGFANLTGSFKMAKNILAVGAVDESGIVAPLSSKGPAYDGRVKPELAAYGKGGSSEAAAMVSGIALLLQDAYIQQNGMLPDNALLKAILINSAEDVGNKGIDFSSGYGNVNAYLALQTIQSVNYFPGSINSNQEKLFTVTLPANAVDAKFTLVWNDPPAAPNAFKSLVNDLDMQVTQGVQQWLPWVLSSFPHIDSLQLPPLRKRDSINVVEQVSIENPAAGVYTAHVKAGNITGTQNFFIAYQWDTLQHFKWTYPAGTDNFIPASANTFRWSTRYAGKKGRLEYSVTNGDSWRYIDSVDLDTQQYTFTAPDTFTTALARITVDNTSYTSDTFTISSPLPLQVGFNCADSVSLYWNKIDGVNNYVLYTMGSKYLEQARTVADTFVVFQQSATSSPYFTVAPVLSATKQAAKSVTIHSGLQGVECYLKNFLADLQADNTVALTLNLSSSFSVKQIHFEKQQTGSWTVIQLMPVDADNNYSSTDNSPSPGINYYRAKIELMNGVFIYSDVVAVNYLGSNDFIVFPNPVNRNQPLNILSKQMSDYTLMVYDVMGRKVMQQRITALLQPVWLRGLEKGLYILSIQDGNKRVFMRKLLVL